MTTGKGYAFRTHKHFERSDATERSYEDQLQLIDKVKSLLQWANDLSLYQTGCYS